VNGRPTKPKLGNFPDMSVEQARTEAIRMLSAISKGEPVHSRALSKPTSLSLGEMFGRYIDEYAQHHCTTWQEARKSFKRYFGVWLSRSVDTITRAEVQQHMNVLGKERGHHTANRAFDDLRAVYSWAPNTVTSLALIPALLLPNVEPKAGWRKFLDRTKLKDLRMHDLRRTLESYMAMNNQSLQIIGRVLGHKSTTATQIYSRLASDPIKQAMEAAQASMSKNSDILPVTVNKRRLLKRVKS